MPRGRNTRLTQEEAVERFAAAGYTLVGVYVDYVTKVYVTCNRHGETHHVRPGHVFRGMRIPCCASERRSELGKLLTGTKNPFFGRHHSPETVATISAIAIERSPFKGKSRGQEFADKIRAARTGIARPESMKAKLSAYWTAKHYDFDACTEKARTSKTHGKIGYFYIADIGNGEAKFGSTSSLKYRRRKLQAQYGQANILAAALVHDAAGYEAEMMSRFRDKWIRGEIFALPLI